MITYRVLIEKYANIIIKANNKKECNEVAKKMCKNKNIKLEDNSETKWQIIDSYDISSYDTILINKKE